MISVAVRVLVVDASAADRRLVCDVLTGRAGQAGRSGRPGRPLQAAIDVVGTAAGIPAALAKVAELRPHAVVLDAGMSIKDDGALLAQLRAVAPDLVVVVLCPAGEDGAAIAFTALAAGAGEFAKRPVNQDLQHVRSLSEHLIAPLIGLHDARRLAAHPELPRGPLPVPYPTAAAIHEAVPFGIPPQPDHRQELAPFLVAAPFPLPGRRALLPGMQSRPSLPIRRIVRQGQCEPAIGSSAPGAVGTDFAVLTIGAATGGPQALTELLAGLPADLPVPVLVVQQLPRLFTGRLAARLDGCGPLAVAEAVEGEQIVPGRVLIAPGGRHLEVLARGSAMFARLTDSPPESSHRPSADILFRSAAAVFRHRTLGVVLTGLGRDGVQGATAVRNVGGVIFAQDEASSAVWGMPGAVVGAGQADRVLPLSELAGQIVATLSQSNNVVALAGAGSGGGRHQRTF